MSLLLLTLAISVFGLVALWLAQPAPPHEIVVWNDDVERRLLRDRGCNENRW